MTGLGAARFIGLMCRYHRRVAVCRLTPRWSQRRLRLELMDGLSYTTIIEPVEPFARRRGWYVLQSYSTGGEEGLE